MGTAGSQHRRGRVLVVDDDRAVRDLEIAALERGGYDVVSADDAESALALLDGIAGGADGDGAAAAETAFDVVLFDNRLPGMSGVEALAKLRSNPATRMLPVILVTADDEVGARVAGLEAGADDYVIKPFSPPELLARVNARVRQHDAWDQVIAGHLEERAGVARVLRAAAASGSLEDRASTLCASFCELRAIAGAALVIFEGDGMATAVAAAGAAPWAFEPGGLLPAIAARLLEMRATDGPWVEGPATMLSRDLVHDCPIACAPLGDPDHRSGVLMLVPATQRPGDMSQALASGIDFGTMVQGLLRSDLDQRGLHRRRRFQIEQVLRDGAFVPHFQPIVDLRDGHLPIVGVEALTRFADGTAPDARFRFAASCGLGLELERMTLGRALVACAELPENSWVSVNVSPTLVMEDDSLGELLATCPRDVVLELSEQERVEDYAKLQSRVRALDPKVGLSIDDAGSGFASLRHILLLQPEYVKLDRSWVQDVDTDPARQALIAGLVHFSETTGCRLIAEGIETHEERKALEDLGVDYGQGFLLGFPQAAA